jgi:hypothetical protein
MGEGTPVRQWILAVAGILMIVAAGAIALRGGASLHSANPAPAVRPAPTPVYVQHAGQALQFHWDPNAPAVRAARKGALIIADGARESRLDLAPRDLRSGLASYRPDSPEVTFRLELDGAPAGSVRTPAVVADDRPSPFDAPSRPRKHAAPVSHIDSQPAVGPVYVADSSRHESGFGRALGKIPLLRRLRKHPADDDR